MPGSGRVALAGALLLLAVLGGCGGGDSLADRSQGAGYLAGDGTIQRYAPRDRDIEISVRGPSLTGTELDTAQWRGSVVVINTWGSWCSPCNAEAPDLAAVSREYSQRGVKFIGINLKQRPEAGMAFERKFKIPYPSVAWDGGKVLLQLKGKAASTPTTLIIDPQGRLAGRVSGQISRSTLTGLLDQVLAEDGFPSARPTSSRSPE